VSALLDLAKPRRIKASHRRRRNCASGHRVYIMNNPLSGTDPTGYDDVAVTGSTGDGSGAGADSSGASAGDSGAASANGAKTPRKETFVGSHIPGHLDPLLIKSAGGAPGNNGATSGQSTTGAGSRQNQAAGESEKESAAATGVNPSSSMHCQNYCDPAAKDEWKEDPWSKRHWDQHDTQAVTTTETDDAVTSHDEIITRPLEKGLYVTGAALGALYWALKQTPYLLGGGAGADARAVEETAVAAGEAGSAAGRLGSSTTRAHVAKVAGEMEARGWKITGGGGKLPEEYLRGPNGRAGSSFPDITATKNGRTLRVNTIDTRADGIAPTTREARNAARIRAQTPGDHLLLVPKP
jgi:hypothetical protein